MSLYKMSGTKVVSFSGGRTSAYMLRQVLDANDDLDDLIVTFANTDNGLCCEILRLLTTELYSAHNLRKDPCVFCNSNDF